jgi:hypothetical protein
MPDVAIDPASPEPGRLDGCDPPLQGLWASGTPRDMPQSGAGRRGHLQRMVILLLIAAEVGRPSQPLGLLHAEQVLEETQRSL